MSITIKANDWEACGICQMGGAAGFGGGVYFFDFHSAYANCKAHFIFIGIGAGAGGSIGGATAPSPTDIYNQFKSAAHLIGPTPVASPFTSIVCNRDFSAMDLHKSSGSIGSIGASVAYGYSGVFISAKLHFFNASPDVPYYFREQSVSGWGVGVGLGSSAFDGWWLMMGSDK